jgi:hypothetical protein
MGMDDKRTDNQPNQRRGQPLSSSDIEHIANEQITERFQGIGIDDSSFEAKQKTVANNRLINSMREARENRDARLKRSVWSIATSIGGNATWAIVVALFLWLLQAIHSGTFPELFK